MRGMGSARNGTVYNFHRTPFVQAKSQAQLKAARQAAYDVEATRAYRQQPALVSLGLNE